jgi:molybdopterin/thiamine biosynthesis adenylyltransferase
MNDNQLLRYSRHILLDEIGIEGQARLLAAHALVIGAGGLGSPAALYLAASGVGHITLVDDDAVDLTNLQRQVMHTTERVGMAKVESGRAALQAINPDVKVTALRESSSNRAGPIAPAMPACSPKTAVSRMWPAARWACSRRWSASSAPPRRPKR